MNTPAATVTSTWAFVPPTSAMPYSTRITKAFLKTLSLIAPRNCVTNSGRKRRERSRTISGWRIGRSLRKATGGDHRHALSKRSLTYCRVPLQVNPAVAVAVPARRELPGCPRRRNAAYDRTDLIPVESAGATPCFGGAARSEEHTSELQSLMRTSYAVFCLKKTKQEQQHKQQRTE